MRLGPLEFHLVDEDARTPWRASSAWVVADDIEREQTSAWHLRDTPPDADERGFEIADMKRWLLFGASSDAQDTALIQKGQKRVFYIGESRRGQTILREATAEDVFTAYVEKLREEVDAAGARPVAMLYPAVPEEARGRYLTALKKVAPRAEFYSEPEMVAEYFRLVRGDLVLDPQRNNVILVIDVGASTANATVILSNRGGAIVGGRSGVQRDTRLRAINGVAAATGGRWVDEQLARNLDLAPPSDPDERVVFWHAIEEAKRQVSRTRESVEIHGALLEPSTLVNVSWQLVEGLEGTLDHIWSRLWDQSTSTDHARKLNEAQFAELDVNGPESASRLVTHVVLAGGSSLMPEFEEAIRHLLPTDTGIRFLRVQNDFPIAAAVGTLAHILNERHPSQLIRGDGLAQPALAGGLPFDVSFRWRPRKGKERSVGLLKAGQVQVYETVKLTDVAKLNAQPGPIRGRLVKGSGAEYEGHGQKPQSLQVTQAKPRLSLTIDQNPIIRAKSDHISGLHAVYLDISREASVSGSPDESAGTPKSGEVEFGADDVVVFDVGMSKTVIVSSAGGSLAMGAGLAVELREAAHLPGEPTTTSRTAETSSTTTTETSPIMVAPDGGSDPDRSRGEALAGTPDETPARGVAGATNDTSPGAADGGAGDVTGVGPGITSSGDSDVPASAKLREGLVPSNDTRDASGASAESDADVPPAAGADSSHSAHDDDTPPSNDRQPSAAPAPAGKPPAGFADEFLRVWDEVGQGCDDSTRTDLAYLLLSVAVRPFVLISGPPGCGKSSLARLAAQALGCSATEPPGGQRRFVEVSVKAHWIRPDDLPEDARVASVKPTTSGRGTVFLFDEVNLTRPEYYLSDHFHTLDVTPAPRWCAFGTLNIDEASRPPSPKIVDRCMLVEMTPRSELNWSTNALDRRWVVPSVPCVLPSIPGGVTPDALDLPGRIVDALSGVVREQHLRDDLLPSRRSLRDIAALVSLHESMGAIGEELVTRDDLIDRVIVSRLLVKIQGSAEQVRPAIHTIRETLKGVGLSLERTRRRIGLFEKQLEFGFASPWQ